MFTVAPAIAHGDIDGVLVARAVEEGVVGWDIETTGLNWKSDSINTCQLAIGDQVVIVQLKGEAAPTALLSLLEDQRVRKIFHHAPFDLRFMAQHWDAQPANIACTKVAAKIVTPGSDPSEYSLKPLVLRYLAIELDKTLQRSDWSREDLSAAQIEYAASDVRHLHALLEALEAQARKLGVEHLLRASYDYLPVRVALDLRRSGDVFAY